MDSEVGEEWVGGGGGGGARGPRGVKWMGKRQKTLGSGG